MEQVKYIGESLWLGQIGNLAIVLGFVSALFAGISYFIAAKNRNSANHQSWKSLGKIGYYVHGISMLVLMGLIFYGMVNHMYEYKYIFEHVSDDLPMRYILSAFWEGQEGSFMLWMFWHIILGFVIIRNDDVFHAPVMMVLAFVEAWISSMLLGIHIDFFDEVYKIGSNPVVLIRQVTEAPIFANANYLELIEGRGLNPLLQNYWNTIHPPTTFLGFASTVVPFAYAVGGLMYNEHKLWLKFVYRWGLFSGFVLGVGILMGSLWAYEALSFGGYWAWDPVENTSLVPWIILVAGIHTNMIANNTGYSGRITYFSYLLAFILIVYSTLLTRSGILGDTSAHAFTEMGLEWQLLTFLLFFIAMAIFYFFYRWKHIPSPKKEESIYSREFWMFIGSLVLFFSGFLIDFSSSLPVFNTLMKVFDENYVGKVIQDPIEHYNKYQIWIAVLVSVLSGLAIFLRYKDQGWNKNRRHKVFTRLLIHLGVAAIATFLFARWIALPSWQFVIMAFTAFFTMSSNIDYIVGVTTRSLQTFAAGIAHFGFGMMVLGILSTGLNHYYLNNKFVFKGLFQEGDEEKYVQLIKGSPLLVRGHIVTYESDTLIGRARYYDILFQKVDKDLNIVDSFRTRPNAVYANDFSKIAAFNPDTRHYFDKDIFTCVVNLPPAIMDMEQAKQIEDTLKFEPYTVSIGDTVILEGGKLVVNSFSFNPKHPEYQSNAYDFGLEVEYDLVTPTGNIDHSGLAAAGISGNLLYKFPDKSENFGTIVRPSDAIFDDILSSEEDLDYQTFIIGQGETISFNGIEIRLASFDKNLDSVKYKLLPKDIAIGAELELIIDGQLVDQLKPVYIIRGAMPMGVKDFSPSTGIHSRMTNIDPVKEQFEFKLAKNAGSGKKLNIEIAQNVPRTDYLILEAKVFPGINLFWLGSLLMMVGLIWALFVRRSKI